MIICHCNQITSGDLEHAVCCLMRQCNSPDLCPSAVYGELGACPKCCQCFPLAEKVIKQGYLQFICQAEIEARAGEEPGLAKR